MGPRFFSDLQKEDGRKTQTSRLRPFKTKGQSRKLARKVERGRGSPLLDSWNERGEEVERQGRPRWAWARHG